MPLDTAINLDRLDRLGSVRLEGLVQLTIRAPRRLTQWNLASCATPCRLHCSLSWRRGFRVVSSALRCQVHRFILYLTFIVR